LAERERIAQVLRGCGLIEHGVEESFDRLARLTVAATRAPICVVMFGATPDVHVKGYSGPADEAPAALVPFAMHDVLIEGRREIVVHGEVAGCAVTTRAGLVVGGVWLRTFAPRTWTDDMLELLAASAALAQTELTAREGRRPGETEAQILESISDACVFLDRDWRYTYMNRRAGEIFGRDPSEMVGKHIWTEFPEGVGQPYYHAYHRAMREQEPLQIEEHYVPYDRWFENRIFPSEDGLAIFFQDVTEQKRASLESERVARKNQKEMEVRAQAERMAHLGFWVWDVGKNRIRWSDELYRIYGLEPGSCAPSFETYLSHVHPQDRTRVRDTIERALRDKSPIAFEERIVRPEGEVRWLHSWGNVAVNEEGQVTEIFGTCLDMTELVRATEALRRKEKWLEAALESARIALFEWEIQANQVHWSPGAEKALGLPEGALGASFDAYLSYVHQADREAVIEVLRVSVDTSADLELEHRLELPGDELRWVVARGCVAQDASRRSIRVLGTIVDVTELHVAKEEQSRLLEELRHAQKMEAIGQLSASVAHDINNMLTVVRGAHELLDREASLSGAAKEALSNVDEANRRASALTAQLLKMSRDEKLEVEAIDLNEVIDEAATLYGRVLPEDVKLELELAPELRPVLGDRGQIDRVLLNLVLNARDAMPEGGVMTITTEDDDERAVMKISDTGVGMPPEVKARIFEPFYTTKSDRGTGLGLSTVYGIVRQSNGDIEVDSAPGSGSRFTIRLPYADGLTHASRESRGPIER
jgi:PAS domain S-box-containing protein